MHKKLKITKKEMNDISHIPNYLPHHGVINVNKPT